MGRVRRYKKIKACDLGGKRTKATTGAGAGGKSASKHDEPPSAFEDRVRKAETRRLKGLDENDEDVSKGNTSEIPSLNKTRII
jgi:hypothetical protein